MVTSWNYCYYTEGLSNSIDYTATFAVWRNDSTSSNLVMVAGSRETVVMRLRLTIAAIYCEVINLNNTDEYFSIMEGDYVGAVLPPSNSIPILGVESEFSLLEMTISTMEINSLQYNNLVSREWALNLHASIGIVSKLLWHRKYYSYMNKIINYIKHQ